MLYKITLQLQTMTGWTIVTEWKLVNKFLKKTFDEYGDVMLGYKIETINVV